MYKTNFEENKRKWAKKVEASAGDAADSLKEMKKERDENDVKIKNYEELIGRLQRENQVFRGQLNVTGLGISIEKMEKLIEASEAERSSKLKVEIKNKELADMLAGRRSKFGAMSVGENVKFFEKKDKMFHYRQQQAFQQVQEEVEEELKNLRDHELTTFELLYHHRLAATANFDSVDYEVKDVLEYVTDENMKTGGGQSQTE